MQVTVWVIVAPDGEVSATARRPGPERVVALMRNGSLVFEAALDLPDDLPVTDRVESQGVRKTM